MRPVYVTWMLCVCFVALLGLIGTAGGALQINPHTGEDCQACHLQSNVTPGNAAQLIAPQEALCSGCHETTVIASHPSGVQLSQRESRQLPDEFPLSRPRTMTCTTCHFVHGEENSLRDIAHILDMTYCVQCHDASFFAGMLDGGESLMQFGHLLASGEIIDPVGMDAFSTRCLECHVQPDGPEVVAVDGNIVRHGNAKSSHPIGVDYDRAVEYGGYRPRPLLDPSMYLPGGRVSCLTCHAGYDAQHGLLVVAPQDMCQECHLR